MNQHESAVLSKMAHDLAGQINAGMFSSCCEDTRFALRQYSIQLLEMAQAADLQDNAPARSVLVPPCEVPVLMVAGELPIKRRFRLCDGIGFLTGAKA